MTDLPNAETLLDDLLVIEGFIPDQTCNSLVATHCRHVEATERSDNGLPVQRLKYRDRALFGAVRSVIDRVVDLIDQHFHERIGCDLALLCAITGTFRHTLHADNCYVACPRHGVDAETLVTSNCRCADIEVIPNHTSWRKYSALMYLDSDHEGGDIVFGEGPNVFGEIYLKSIKVRRGLLVLSPSNEFYHHRTTPVRRGTRYSLNAWFTGNKSRFCAALA